MNSSRTAAVVITPQVRVHVVDSTTGPAADDPEESQQSVGLGDATFEEAHRVKEVEERRALNGCVWFRCQACCRTRRLLNWNPRMSKRRRLPTRCDEHPEPRRRAAGCAATDEWLTARLGAAFGDLAHKRLTACEDAAGRDTGCSASIERGAVLAELGIVATPLTEMLLREHLFISVPEDPRYSLRAAPPLLYRLAEGRVVWARAQQADWWPGQIVEPVSTFGSGDTSDAYFVRFYGPGHPAGEHPVAVKTQRLRPFCTEDPSGGGLHPDEQQDQGQDAARSAAIKNARATFNELTGVLPTPSEQHSRGSELPSRTLSTNGGVPSEADDRQGSEDDTDLSLDDSDDASSNDEDGAPLSAWQGQRHGEGLLKKSDAGSSRQLQMRDRLRAALASIGKIPRKKDINTSVVEGKAVAASATKPPGASQQNGGLGAAASSRGSVPQHKETFATAAVNAAQERRVSGGQEPKRHKSAQSVVHCHRSPSETNARRWSGNGDDIRYPAGSDRQSSSYYAGADTHRYSRRPTPLRRRSRSLDRRVDALRADILVQLGQQRRAGADALNRYMDTMASKAGTVSHQSD